MAAALTTEFWQSANFEGCDDHRRCEFPPARCRAARWRSYALLGTIMQEGQRVRVATRLVRFSNGSVIWADTFERDLGASSKIAAATGLARDIVTAVAQQPYGTIFRPKQ